MQTPRDPVATLLQTAFGYQGTAALRAAVDLDLFTAIAEGNRDVESLARRCNAAPRGIRILCDSLVAQSLLEKHDGRYAVPADLAPFVDRRQPTFLASAIDFLASDTIQEAFRRLTTAVRQGGTALSEQGSTEPDHPMWVDFARAMAPVATFSAQLLANLLEIESAPGGKVLDVATGHGMFGITLAQRNPKIEVVALDWKNVLALAEENAGKAGVAERFRPLPGSAFEVDPGTDYDLVLIPNFLHHFDPPTCESFLRRVRGWLKPDGRAVTVEFVPDEDRVRPRESATFALVMLASTPAGDAYTFTELEEMFSRAGFSRSELREIPPSFQRVVISHR